MATRRWTLTSTTTARDPEIAKGVEVATAEVEIGAVDETETETGAVMEVGVEVEMETVVVVVVGIGIEAGVVPERETMIVEGKNQRAGTQQTSWRRWRSALRRRPSTPTGRSRSTWS